MCFVWRVLCECRASRRVWTRCRPTRWSKCCKTGRIFLLSSPKSPTVCDTCSLAGLSECHPLLFHPPLSAALASSLCLRCSDTFVACPAVTRFPHALFLCCFSLLLSLARIQKSITPRIIFMQVMIRVGSRISKSSSSHHIWTL